MSLLEEFLVKGVLAFVLVFVRTGTAIMIMPTTGDTFAPQNVRLHIALAFAFVVSPIVAVQLPSPLPVGNMLPVLVVTEFIIGVFFGTIVRILTTALDTAGMIISMQSGLSNAQLFNPIMASQGSIIGAFLSVTGVVMLFVTDLHHLLFRGLVGSYSLFPAGAIPDAGSMAQMMAKTVSASFAIGVQISAPFLVIGLMLYISMGVLARLMPQLQIFILSIPIQIMVSLLTLIAVFSSCMMFWLGRFEEGVLFFFSSAGP